MSLSPRAARRGAGAARAGGRDPPRRRRRAVARSCQQPDPPRLGPPRRATSTTAREQLVDEALDIRRGCAADRIIRTSPTRSTSWAGWRSAASRSGSIGRRSRFCPAYPRPPSARRDLLQALSTNLRRQGRLAEAVATAVEALAVARASFGREHDTTGYAMIHLGRSRRRHRAGRRGRGTAVSPRARSGQPAIRREQRAADPRVEQPRAPA